MNLKSILILLLCFLACRPSGFTQCGNAVGDTVYVTNTNNVNAGSFRDAILCVNNTANTIRFIHFNIGDAGVSTISPTGAAPLPNITNANVVIDARTEPAWFLGKVVIDGSTFSSSNHGLNLQGNNISVYGLTITGFTNTSTGGGIHLIGNNALVSQNALIGNRFGVQTSSPFSFTISDNVIGEAPVSNASDGNSVAGINILSSAGGSYVVDNNTIANSPNGIVAASSAINLLIEENSIYCNQTKGIERSGFSVSGFTLNSATTTTVSGSGPNGALIEVFIDDDTGCGAANPGCQGKTFLGTATVSGGTWSLTVPVGDIQSGDEITATATVGGNNTSEFVSCLTAVCAGGTINFTNVQGACGGTATGTATATASVPGFYTYEWSDGQMNQDAIGLVPDTYTVSATDASGCVFTGDVTIENLALPAANPFGNDPLCVGETLLLDANVSGGTPTYTYNWEGPEGFVSSQATPSRADIQVIEGGTYSVTVTDMNMCEDRESVTITVNEAPTFNLISQDVSCNGVLDGRIDLVPVAITPPITYLWSNAADTEDLSNLGPGTYTVTVTDGNNCSASDSQTIAEPPALVISNIQTTSPSMVGGSDGTMSFTLNGGAPPYSYSWTGPVNGSDNLAAAGMATITMLSAGNYNLQITDNNSCTLNQNFTISAFNCTLAVSDAMVEDESCAGNMDGSISLVMSNGTPPYSYNWTNGSGNDSGAGTDINNLGAATYNITLTDQAGCQALTTQVVNTTTPPTPGSASLSSCDEDGSGTAIFDLTTLESIINPDPNLSVLWFEDAAGTMPIADPENHESATDLVYAAISEGGCRSSLVSSQLTVLLPNDPMCMPGGCTSFAGTFSLTDPQEVCGSFSAIDLYNNDAVLDDDDTLVFVLHTIAGESLGTILSMASTATAVFDPGNMDYGVTYYLTAVVANNNGAGGIDLSDPCLSVASGQAVVFNEMLSGVLNFIQGEEVLCQGEDLFLSTNVVNGVGITYHWILPTGDTIETDAANLLIENVQSVDAGDYYVFVQDDSCLFDQTGPFTLAVLGLPIGEQVYAGNDTTICVHQYMLNASPVSEGNGSWTGPNGVNIGNPGAASTLVSDLRNGANQFIWRVSTEDCGTIGMDTITVIVADGLQAVDDFFTLAQANSEIFMDVVKNDGLADGTDYTLRALTQPEFGELLNLGHGFQYFESEGLRGIVSFVYEVCYTNSNCVGSCDTATVTIEVLNLPYLPEGFTPNGDGNNDLLAVLGYAGGGDISMRLKIANRWGDIVYESDDYLKAEPWNGHMASNKKSLPEGTYYAWMEITVDGETYQQSQALYLIK